MAFSRNSLAAAVAGTLSLAVLTGCPAAAPTGTTPTAVPTAGTPGASTAPTTAPGESAAPTTAPGASAAPSAVPSASMLEKTTVRGKVYDLEYAPVGSGAKVTVKSLNPSNPFESTVDVLSGSYVVNDVPAGVQLEITATKAGWTSRTRVETLLPLTSTQANIVNFGAASATDKDDAEGRAYFISKYPEVTAVEPADEAENVDPTKVTVKLTLSEALDSTNQRRFGNAIRVYPTDAPNVDTVTSLNGGFTLLAIDDNYSVKEGSIFMDDDSTRATVTWDAEGKVATLNFNAPLLANDSENLEYAIGLVAQSAEIEDAEGNGLGTEDGETFGMTGDGETDLIQNAFREDDLSIDEESPAPLPEYRVLEVSESSPWVDTHQNITTFEVAEDDTDPTLTGVSVTEVGAETRINLTFSEPMAAYNDTTIGKFDESLRAALNYTFAVGEEASDLNDVDLEGDSTLYISGTTDNYGAASEQQETEFHIGTLGGTYNTAPTTADSGNVYMEVSPTDPKTVRLVIESTTFFADDVNAIKARVEGVKDPAGNAITNTQADAQVKTGNI